MFAGLSPNVTTERVKKDGHWSKWHSTVPKTNDNSGWLMDTNIM